VRRRYKVALFELLLLASSAGCKQPREAEPKPPAVASALGGLAPHSVSRFVCSGGKCRQTQPRLPDTGEWRCADGGSAVWCAGGEPAAGVVSGAAEPRFRCGARWGSRDERVCIDANPDYPEGQAETYACAFEQEVSIARVCKLAPSQPQRPRLAARVLPACWLDRDCPSSHCDRGACLCQSQTECQTGSCENGFCSGGPP
jgi:hypothetical protein